MAAETRIYERIPLKDVPIRNSGYCVYLRVTQIIRAVVVNEGSFRAYISAKAVSRVVGVGVGYYLINRFCKQAAPVVVIVYGDGINQTYSSRFC